MIFDLCFVLGGLGPFEELSVKIQLVLGTSISLHPCFSAQRPTSSVASAWWHNRLLFMSLRYLLNLSFFLLAVLYTKGSCLVWYESVGGWPLSRRRPCFWLKLLCVLFRMPLALCQKMCHQKELCLKAILLFSCPGQTLTPQPLTWSANFSPNCATQGHAFCHTREDVIWQLSIQTLPLVVFRD